MLFNSYEFLFVYLPIVALGFFWIARFGHRWAAAWLVVASLAFYGWWNPKFVALLLASIAFNYGAGIAIGRATGRRQAKTWLVSALTANLVLLGVFKYANFFLSTLDNFTGARTLLTDIVLPLGISFFTFTQITFLVDVYRGVAREYNIIHYALFVSYFPHLIAGPILHHKQMMPQFESEKPYTVSSENVAIGLTIFAIGLSKKVLLADSFGDYAGPIFDSARDGVEPRLLGAWAGALSYTLQIYFDFSGYSDMAIGLSRIVGIHLPINFNSPYRAQNIIEFWRCWHMTLSQFLKEYLYIPLGGNRLGRTRRYINLMITMLLGGLWHGASWTFVIWGGLHGLYLVVNHVWHAVRSRIGLVVGESSRGGRIVGTGVTFLAVVVAWVLFRSSNFDAAVVMLRGMAGLNGVALPASISAAVTNILPSVLLDRIEFAGLFAGTEVLTTFGGTRLTLYFLLGFLIIWTMPNTQELFSETGKGRPLGKFLRWQPTPAWAAWSGVLLAMSIMALQRVSEFLYFQF